MNVLVVDVCGTSVKILLSGQARVRKLRSGPELTAKQMVADVAVALFGLAKQGFGWYVQFAEANIPLHGALGAFLFFFLWLYYASVVFVLGAEADWVFEHRGTLERTANMER